jgi:F0F1-type ATP synthase delta subunit
MLPTLILGPADVNRTLLELQELEDFLSQAALRKQADVLLPKMSRTLESLAITNKSDLLKADDRAELTAFLQSVQLHAPVLHVSFASEPSAAFTARIVEWFRANVSKYSLVQVGLQPSIAAGCIVRSPSKVFDLSLRRSLDKNKELMTTALEALAQRDEAAAVAKGAVS